MSLHRCLLSERLMRSLVVVAAQPRPAIRGRLRESRDPARRKDRRRCPPVVSSPSPYSHAQSMIPIREPATRASARHPGQRLRESRADGAKNTQMEIVSPQPKLLALLLHAAVE